MFEIGLTRVIDVDQLEKYRLSMQYVRLRRNHHNQRPRILHAPAAPQISVTATIVRRATSTSKLSKYYSPLLVSKYTLLQSRLLEITTRST